MNQNRARVENSKARVMGAVVDLIVDGGVRAVSVDAVQARSGVAKTTIYRHWPSREALVADALGSTLPDQAAPDTGSLAGDLRVLARGLAAGLADDRIAALLAAIALPDGDPSLDAVRHEATAGRHRIVRQVVAQARRRGEAVPVDGADGIIRSIAGPLFYRRFVEGVAPTRTLADRCVERALTPLGEPSPSPTARSSRGDTP